MLISSIFAQMLLLNYWKVDCVAQNVKKKKKWFFNTAFHHTRTKFVLLVALLQVVTATTTFFLRERMRCCLLCWSMVFGNWLLIIINIYFLILSNLFSSQRKRCTYLKWLLYHQNYNSKAIRIIILEIIIIFFCALCYHYNYLAVLWEMDKVWWKT